MGSLSSVILSKIPSFSGRSPPWADDEGSEAVPVNRGLAALSLPP